MAYGNTTTLMASPILFSAVSRAFGSSSRENRCVMNGLPEIFPCGHQGQPALHRAFPLAPDAVQVDVVADHVGSVEGYRFPAESRQTHLPAPLGAVQGLVDGVRGTGALHDQVHAQALRQVPYPLHQVLPAHVHHPVRPEFLSQPQPALPGARQDHGGAQGFPTRHRHEPDGTRPDHQQGFARYQSPEHVQAVQRGARGDDEGGLVEGDVVRQLVDGVDVVDGVLGKPSVGGEPVGPVPLGSARVVQARGVHPVPAALAAPASRVHLHHDPVAHAELVHGRAQLHDRAHVLVADHVLSVEG